MIPATPFCDLLTDHGVTLVTGVPCSYLAAPLSRLTDEGRYVPAANEGAAVVIAAGAALAGTRGAVLAQNSGLGNMVNPLTSLLLPYAIPALVFMSLRGWPDARADEPQHAVMGGATHRLLDVLGVPHWTLRAGMDVADLGRLLDAAEQELSEGRCAFVLVEKGALEPALRVPAAGASPSALTRAEAIAALTAGAAGAFVVSTTGYTSRDLFASGDAPTHFYMQGSMGHAAALGLGVALSAHDTPVVVLDGDGAALMHLGTMSTIGAAAPKGLVHVVLDNQRYESTGAQATTSSTTDFAAVAAGLGYASTAACRTAEEIDAAVAAALAAPGPHLLVITVQSSAGPAPARATSALSTPDIHHRFAAALAAAATVPERSDR